MEADDSQRLWYDGTAACCIQRRSQRLYWYGNPSKAGGTKLTRIESGSTLDELLNKSIPLDPVARAILLEKTPALADAHKEAATQGDTSAPDAQDDVDLHYVCFVKGKDGGIWELDGRRKGPIRRGDLEGSEDVLSERGLAVGALKFLEREGGDLRFSAVALAGTLD